MGLKDYTLCSNPLLHPRKHSWTHSPFKMHSIHLVNSPMMNPSHQPMAHAHEPR